MADGSRPSAGPAEQQLPDDVDATEKTSSTTTRAITDALSRPLVASANWATICEPRVAPGASSECGSPVVPMTMATAMSRPAPGRHPG